jgi:hypothetical protein
MSAGLVRAWTKVKGHQGDRFDRHPARASSGHVATPPRSVMNSRRFMRFPPGETGTLSYH